MADDNLSPDAKPFMTRVLAAVPQWAVGILGVVFGTVVIMAASMQILGVSGHFQRIADSYATRLEKSAESVDTSVKALTALIIRIESVETRTDKLAVAHVTIENRMAHLETAVAWAARPGKTTSPKEKSKREVSAAPAAPPAITPIPKPVRAASTSSVNANSR